MATASHAPRHDHDSGAGLRSVEEVRAALLERIVPLPSLEVPLGEAFGCVLAEDLVSPLDLPAFASSGMDGVAVRASDTAAATAEAPVSRPIVGRALIGREPEGVVGAGEAIRIATGSPVPAGADVIVPIEQVVIERDTVRIFHPAEAGRFVRPAGEDVRSGEVLAQAGRRLGAPELGLLANAGYAGAAVFPRPRVVVISTGDELVEPGHELTYGQIFDSNTAMLMGQVREAGGHPIHAGPVPDDPERLREIVANHGATADAFVSSGGVSAGERDVVKVAFQGQGNIDFYGVAMQPGMPQAFGVLEGKPYFGLPGNPVSSFVSFEVFVRPALLRMMGRRHLERPTVAATLSEAISGPGGKMQFARVLVERGAAGFTATPTGGRASNLLSTVARANGFAMIPPGTATAEAGSQVQVMVFRSMED